MSGPPPAPATLAEAQPATSGEPPLLVIAGPTAVGKTRLAIDLALRFGGEVISADAMQVYRHMDIGTAKPSPAERRGVPHHLIDVVEPGEPFSVARYRQLAETALAAIRSRGRLAIVCGGTGLYIRAFVDGLLPPAGYHPALRQQLQARAQRIGAPALHAQLAQVDPDAARRIHPNDARRIIRALEVFHATGEPISRLQAASRQAARPHPAVRLALEMARPALYRQIDARVDAQLAAGLVEEVRRLLARGVSPDSTAMQALGYKEIAAYLSGRRSFAAAVTLLKQATRRYAKRQWTWFRADPRLRWFCRDDYPSWESLVDAVAVFAGPAVSPGASPSYR